MHAFVALRKLLLNNSELCLEIERIKKKLANQGKNIELVFQYLDELIEEKENQKPRVQMGYKQVKKSRQGRMAYK